MGAGEGKKKRAKFWAVRRRGVGRREEMKNKIQKIKHKKETLCKNPKKQKKGKNQKINKVKMKNILRKKKHGK